MPGPFVDTHRRRPMMQLGLHVGEGRIEEGVRLRRQHVERIARGQLGIGLRRFILRNEVGQGIQRLARLIAGIALAEQRKHHVAGAFGDGGLELDLAGGRREVAFAVRDELFWRAHVEAGIAGLAQAGEIDPLEHGAAPIHRIERHLLVRPIPTGIVEAHRARQAAEQLGIGYGLAAGRNGRLVEGQIEVPPREHEIELLELRGGRQHDVGVTRSIGDEMLAHHGEQILARKPLQHLGLLRHHHHRVRVVDEQRIDLLIELAHQRRAEPPLIDHRRALANPVGPAQVVEFHRKRPDRHVQDAAAAVPPRADQGGQAGERTHGVTARRIAFDGDTHADHGGLRGGKLARERADIVGRDPGDPGDHVRREVRSARRQLVIADRVLFDIIVIDQILGDDHVYHAERQGGIGAGLDGDVPVGLLGRAGRDRIDHDHLGAAPLCLRNERPVVQIVADRVDRPEHDVFRINETLRIDRRGRPAGHEKRGDRAGIAECAFRNRGAELVEERVADMEAVENALGPEIAVGKNGSRAVFIDDRVPAARNLVERLIPGDPLEFAPSPWRRRGASDTAPDPRCRPGSGSR